jgi:hypothetical protein
LIRKPADTCAAQPADTDVLSNVLRSVRLTGSLQFCFMPTGAWQTEGKGALSKLADDAAIAIPFHIVSRSCWLRMDSRQTNLGPATCWHFLAPRTNSAQGRAAA